MTREGQLFTSSGNQTHQAVKCSFKNSSTYTTTSSSPWTGWVNESNWTTSESHHTVLHDCGPDEYIFIFYAYYYGLMILVTIIGMVGNSAVIRYA